MSFRKLRVKLSHNNVLYPLVDAVLGSGGGITLVILAFQNIVVDLIFLPQIGELLREGGKLCCQ